MAGAKTNIDMPINILSHPSPNFGPRPDGCPVDILVLHYTGMPTGQAALDRLCDPQSSVSSHYLIEEDGRIFKLVDEDKRAWHAGRGCWQDCTDINSRSIGIEIVNPGHEFGYRAFPDAQIASVVALCQDILARHDIPANRIIAHSDMAPDRKEDPGELFPWQYLAQNGIGIWPDAGEDLAVDPNRFDELLDQIGYGWPAENSDDTGHEDYRTKRVIAFQRRWRSKDISGVIDGQCMAIAAALAKVIGG
ncbi:MULTISPECIES: N-acetylmuramoyl-L-alanine amidase [Thalassospira]|nr:MULTISPECIES: N-acetylmuramoyl-L-alanine amidase [Thalassospira]MDG4719881.1 N-acetylmuramoyl-L-alanine amidase [Thalassospira sp. FZY0004]